MKRYIRSSNESTPEYYYKIMNMLDDAALSGRTLTREDKQQLDNLMEKDREFGLGSDDSIIEDIADANDCYTPNGDLCSTWDEMVVALRGLFESGDRIHVK